MAHSLPNSPPPQYIQTDANTHQYPEVVQPGHYPAYHDGLQVSQPISGADNAPELNYNYGQHPEVYQQYDQSPEAHHHAQYDHTPEVHHKQEYSQYPTATVGAASVPVEAGGRAVDEGAEPSKSLWARRKGLILIGAGVLFLVIIGAVVGGVVGSQRAGQSNTSSSSTSTASGTSPSSPTNNVSPASTDTAAIPARRPGAAASTCTTGEVFSQGIQVFWQMAGSADIIYSIYNNAKDYGPLRKLTLSQPPKNATSMAATSWYRGNNKTNEALVQLFYLLDNDAGRTDIAMAELNCTKAQSCTETKTTIISENVKAQVAANTDLGAVFRGDMNAFQYNIRVYYQAKDTGSLIELSGDSAPAKDWAEKDLEVKAHDGSSIAAVFAPGTSMELYYIDPDNSIQSLVNTDNWVKADVDTSPLKGAGGSGVLEGLWEPSTNNFRLYYVTDDKKIHEYGKTGLDSIWSNGMSPANSTVDNTLAMSSWDADVRIFYVDSGVMKRGWRKTKDNNWTIDNLAEV